MITINTSILNYSTLSLLIMSTILFTNTNNKADNNNNKNNHNKYSKRGCNDLLRYYTNLFHVIEY